MLIVPVPGRHVTHLSAVRVACRDCVVLRQAEDDDAAVDLVAADPQGGYARHGVVVERNRHAFWRCFLYADDLFIVAGAFQKPALGQCGKRCGTHHPVCLRPRGGRADYRTEHGEYLPFGRVRADEATQLAVRPVDRIHGVMLAGRSPVSSHPFHVRSAGQPPRRERRMPARGGDRKRSMRTDDPIWKRHLSPARRDRRPRLPRTRQRPGRL